ncbi:MAG: HupE/UreJ family protein [Deltaproteobacteria bacterium]|nr:HupE/UreJ family protein [Deltaproteobacteria bacterium]
MTRRLGAACLVALACWAAPARADVFRPAYLELREAGAGRYDVLWKVPAQGESLRLAAEVRFPEGTVETSRAPALFAAGAHVERWRIERPGGLVGETVRIDGIAGGATDVLVRVERADGTSQVERLLPERPQFTVTEPAGLGEVARSYLVLGVEHILGGVDHLLFVLALLLLVRGGRRIVATVTAFTVAHSLTLVAATLGWVRVPTAPVEAVIALSIVFVAAEGVHGLRGRPGLTARAPWVVAFTFGLLHGLGFAGALAEVGLPQRAIPLALLTFNVGVEVGQLLFVAAVLALRRLLAGAPLPAPRWAPYLPPYAIGALATMWVFERIAAF